MRILRNKMSNVSIVNQSILMSKDSCCSQRSSDLIY